MILYPLKYLWIVILTLNLEMTLISDHMEFFFFSLIVDLQEDSQQLLFKVKDSLLRKESHLDADSEHQQILQL